jgi:hypothetical protein
MCRMRLCGGLRKRSGAPFETGDNAALTDAIAASRTKLQSDNRSAWTAKA